MSEQVGKKMESNGRKAVLKVQTKEFPTMEEGVPIKNDYETLHLQHPVNMSHEVYKLTVGRFFTLTELATRDAELVKAAEARGAAAERAVVLKVVELRMISGRHCAAARGIHSTIKALPAPDTAAHDADTRKKERAKVLEEVESLECTVDALTEWMHKVEVAAGFEPGTADAEEILQRVKLLAQDKE